jgi:hypothetical protein
MIIALNDIRQVGPSRVRGLTPCERVAMRYPYAGQPSFDFYGFCSKISITFNFNPIFLSFKLINQTIDFQKWFLTLNVQNTHNTLGFDFHWPVKQQDSRGLLLPILTSKLHTLSSFQSTLRQVLITALASLITSLHQIKPKRFKTELVNLPLR